ncbi:MAG: hypothetical protein UDG94_02060 [Peptococcaceae bacterium]|nr:hypothetical protein [Peptococcaceae bacterium]
MAIQRYLRVAGTMLLALTILCICAVPSGIIPAIVSLIVAALTALDLLALVVLTVIKDHSFRGFVHILLYVAMLLIVSGGIGSSFFNNSLIVEMPQGSTAELSGLGMEGYTLSYESVWGMSIDDASVDVVLTRPDQVSIHETLSQSAPMVYDGIEIHLMHAGSGDVVFLVQYDWFRHLIWIGGILFAIGLGLSAIPAVRRKGDHAC